MARTGDTVIHVELLATGRHYYFGSIAAIYDLIPYEKIKVVKKSLWNAKITPEHPYKNKLCIVRKGVSYRKPSKKSLINIVSQ